MGMRFWTVSLIAAGGFALTALAEEACTEIANDLGRLACYDKLSGRTPSTSSETKSQKWGIQEQTSKLTDDKTINLVVESDEVINCGWNKGAKIALVVRCHEKKTALFFSTGCHMTSSEYNDYGKVEYRSFNGEASTDHKALGLWSGGKSIPVIKQMIGGTKLVARMTPYSESPFTATFDITGLEDAAKSVRKECGW
jgi:type VI secretion system protein VasI